MYYIDFRTMEISIMLLTVPGFRISFLLFLLAAATVTVPAAGQHADARIGALLNSGDYFTLREVLPRQADSIASPVVRGMA